ncbi:MAG TPA: endolytic transglycosylase MltG [Rhodospirillales bacterium]|nr:endolytic transglycosylase MltG [Rhodospirillales bacterium]
MERLLRRFFILFLALGAVTAGVFVWGYGQFVRPGALPSPRTVVIAKGSGLEKIAETLTRSGVIGDSLVFRIAARLTRADKFLQAGEYAFPAEVSQRDALALLQSGKTVLRRLTLAEGLTVAEALRLLEKTDGLVGPVGPIPGEGTLLPETYYFSFGDKRADIKDRMIRAMKETLADLWPGRAGGLALRAPGEALVLASMVEKETALPAERPLIAGVFLNRLRRGMKLQSDPTVAYGLARLSGVPLDRPLSRADLLTPTPFNTYRIKGLPPGPISNPGRASLVAALHPQATDDLYFVADGTGGHVFSRTLKEHNRNVAKWRKNKRIIPSLASGAAKDPSN